ncbi:MAG TPA: hypothetical protein VLT16_02935, partial [Candidatus Limnocylindrales bacterium]|nr:hypothetical protein [Candidatus Limnocylindrales bacterium]
MVFASNRALVGGDAALSNFNLWLVSANGSSVTPLTRVTAPNAASGNAAWSPDGSKLVFASAQALDGSDAASTNSTFNIWVMNADGSAATPLTRLTSGVNNGLPRWSPDGSKIIFVSSRALDGTDATNTNSTLNLWIMNADGSAPLP